MGDGSEKVYSVVVETQDGKTEVISARGASPADAFREAKGLPGVRRVGKVSEAGRPGAYAERRPEPEPRESLLANPVSGPRVVVHARSGGEQPFKHLKPPPERPLSPAPKPVPAPAPMPAKAGTPLGGPATQPATPQDEPSVVEHRIVKSRRRDGHPYLLQRGRWQQAGGKRTFVVESEQGFERREDAEAGLKAGGHPAPGERTDAGLQVA